MKKNSNIMRVRYGFIITLLALFMLFLGVYIGSRRMAQVEAQGYVQERQKFYTCIDIKEGDTLWSLAEEYMTEEYTDRESYMDEVREMNDLTGSMIQAGTTLLIPYYGESEVQTAHLH